MNNHLRFRIQLTKPVCPPNEKTWIDVKVDTGYTYVNIGHLGRFYGTAPAIRVAKSTVPGTYKITYVGPWETESGRSQGRQKKVYYFQLKAARDVARFEAYFELA